jgi:hypothetical protein
MLGEDFGLGDEGMSTLEAGRRASRVITSEFLEGVAWLSPAPTLKSTLSRTWLERRMRAEADELRMAEGSSAALCPPIAPKGFPDPDPGLIEALETEWNELVGTLMGTLLLSWMPLNTNDDLTEGELRSAWPVLPGPGDTGSILNDLSSGVVRSPSVNEEAGNWEAGKAVRVPN